MTNTRKRKPKRPAPATIPPPKAVIRHPGRRAKRSRDPGVSDIMGKTYRRKLTDPLDHA